MFLNTEETILDLQIIEFYANPVYIYGLFDIFQPSSWGIQVFPKQDFNVAIFLYFFFIRYNLNIANDPSQKQL